MTKYEELKKHLDDRNIINDLKCAMKIAPPPKNMPEKVVTYMQKRTFTQCVDMQCKNDQVLKGLLISAAREMVFDKLFEDAHFDNLNIEPTPQQKFAMDFAEMMFGEMFKGM